MIDGWREFNASGKRNAEKDGPTKLKQNKQMDSSSLSFAVIYNFSLKSINILLMLKKRTTINVYVVNYNVEVILDEKQPQLNKFKTKAK